MFSHLPGHPENDFTLCSTSSALKSKSCKTTQSKRTDLMAVGSCGHLSLSDKTVSKQTRHGSHSESKDVKNNKQGRLCVSTLGSYVDKGGILPLSHYLALHMLTVSMAASHLWDILVSAAFNISSLPPSSGVRHTVEIVTSGEWTFPQAGVSLLKLKGGVVHSVLLCVRFRAEIPYYIFNAGQSSHKHFWDLSVLFSAYVKV